MQDERPIEQAPEALDTGAPAAQGESAGAGRTGLLVAGVIAVVALILAGLFLPPISLGQRLGLTGAVADVTPEVMATPAGSSEIPGEISVSAANEARINVTRIEQAEFLTGNVDAGWTAARDGLPTGTALAGAVYALSGDVDPVATGTAAMVVPVGTAAMETLDVYGWDGSRWVHYPSEHDVANARLVTAQGPLPRALALLQVGPVEAPTVAVVVEPEQAIVPELLSLLGAASAAGVRLDSDENVSGEAAAVPDGGYEQWLHVTNRGAIVDADGLTRMLSDPTLTGTHIEALKRRAVDGGYAGIHLDYQGVPAAQRAAFTQFAGSLAGLLDTEGAHLAITLGTPAQLSNGAWDTGGQDYMALGRLADRVFLELPLNPAAYADGGLADQLVAMATRQIDRRKVVLLVSGSAIEAVGDAYRAVSSDMALLNFGELSFVQGGEEVLPGDMIEVALSGTASPLEWDGDGVAYRYQYEANDSPHTVWLNNEAAVNHRLRFGQKYHVAGIAVHQSGDPLVGAGNLAAITSYLGQTEAPVPQGAAIVWSVLNDEGGVLANSNGDALTYSWQTPAEPGTFTIQADFAQGEAINSLGSLAVTAAEPVAEEPEPEVAAPEVVEPAETGPTDTLLARVNIAANVRSGPGVAYPVIAGADPDTTVTVTGRNQGADWLQVQLPDGKEGWIFAQLLDVDGDPTSLVVVAADPPPVASAPSGGGGAAPGPAPVIAPAPGGSFELGGQTHSLASPAQMLYSGMRWIKFQHKWGPGDSPNAVKGRIDSGHANGFKVLLSIPGANTYPSSIDFNGYVEFLRGVAALGPDAIEVWNEQNIDFEWPAGAIDPASYVTNMLAPAYNAIKSANPNVMVISGAPAPTGFFGGGCGTNGCDDNAYLAGMAAAGAANYMDCVGVHYNAGATSPAASSGHPAGGTHYSWYFQPTMNLYYNAFGGSRPVCFTELGYLSGADFGGVPPRFSWAGNTTVAQHAQWLAEAVSLAANSGKVRMVIVFNVDFTYYADDPQAGYAMIRPDGSCPSCDLLARIVGSR